MKRKKLSVGVKTAIAFASVALGAGATVGFMKLYQHYNKIGQQTIEISSLFNTSVDSKKVQEAMIVDSFKKPVAKYHHNEKNGLKTKVTLLVDLGDFKSGSEIAYDEFLDTYSFVRDGDVPSLRLKVGPFEFVNNYIESLSPEEFIEYANWYFENVSWGPDLLTLKEFVLARGVKINRGAITLGQHGGTREETTIEFYPDAFFGSLALYSVLRGSGNNVDSLLRKYNSTGILEDEFQEYVKKIPRMIYEYNSPSFGGLKSYEALKESKKLYVFNGARFIDHPKNTVQYLNDRLIHLAGFKSIYKDNFSLNFVFEADSLEDAKQKANDALSEFVFSIGIFSNLNNNGVFDIQNDDIKKITVKGFEQKTDNYNFDPTDRDAILALNNLIFKTTATDVTTNQTSEYNFDFYAISAELNDNDYGDGRGIQNSNQSIRSLLYHQAVNNNFDQFFNQKRHWRKFYDIDQLFNNKTLYIYDEKDNLINPRFYKNPSQVFEAEVYQYDNTKVKKINIKKVLGVTADEFVIEADVSSNQPNSKIQQARIVLRNIQNNKKGFRYDSSFDDAVNTLAVSIDHYDPFTPKVVKQSSRFIDGKIVPSYELFTEVYSGLIDKVTNKKPYLLKDIEGKYVDISYDENGVAKFNLADGIYKGFFETDRIPYIALVSESDPSFKSTGINYLKYVGAHEYGHHQTLQYIKDISEKNASSIVGHIEPFSGPSLDAYMDVNVLQDYLDARSSGLKVRITDTNYNEQKDGNVINFSYNTNNKDNNSTRWEDVNDIFGSPDGGDLYAFLGRSDRRFLQKFEELQDAAKLRGVELYDLFLMNSLDTESGTINPQFAGNLDNLDPELRKAEYFIDKDINNATFVKPSNQQGLLAYKGILKDGLGNEIQLDPNGRPIVFRVKESARVGGNVRVSSKDDIEILIFKNDGKPVIDLDLFFANATSERDLANAYANFVVEANKVVDNINSLFTNRFSQNGWDTEGNYSKNQNYTLTQLANNRPTDPRNVEIWTNIKKRYINNLEFPITKTFQPTYNSYYEEILDRTNLPWLTNQARNVPTIVETNNETTYLKNYFSNVLRTVIGINQAQGNGQVAETWYDNRSSGANAFMINSLVGKGFKDSNGDIYYAKPAAFLFGGGRYATKGINPVNAVFGISKKTLEDNLKKRNNIVNLGTQATVYDGNSFSKTILELPPVSEVDATSLTDYLSRLSKENTKLKLILPKDVIDAIEPYLNKSNNNFSVSVENLVAESGQSVPVKLINFKSFDDYYKFASLDITKAHAEVVNNSDGTKTLNRVWDKEYLQWFFDFDAIKTYLQTQLKKTLSDAEFDAEVVKFEAINTFFSSDYQSLYKSTKFNLSDLDQYEYIFDNTIGFKRLGSFGTKFGNDEKYQNIGNTFLDRGIQLNALNPSIKYSGVLTKEDDQKFFSTKNVVKRISDKIKSDLKDVNANPQIDLLTIMLYAYGTTQHLDPGYEINSINGVNLAPITNENSPGGFRYSDYSSDYANLNSERKNEELSSVFSNYTYTIAEVLTRDYVQTSYIPSQDNLDNLPNYVSGLNEYNTGNEYVFSGDNTKQWITRMLPIYANASGNDTWLTSMWVIMNNMRDVNKVLENSLKNIRNNASKIKEVYDAITKEEQSSGKPLQNNQIDAFFSNAKQANYLNPNQIAAESLKNPNDLLSLQKNYDRDARSLTVLKNGTPWASPTFFGQTQQTNNGFYKDRWLRKVINWEIYDDNRNPVQDDKIRILELDNKTPVTNRARATWIYSLRSQGIGDRTVSGVYRNKQTDSTLLWGFFKKEYANRVKKIIIEDETTGIKRSINISTENQNNLYYFERQADISTKKTLLDEGYVSWASDYAILSNFKNSLINFDNSSFKGSNFRIYFGDENNNEVLDENNKSLFDLGSRNVIAENGKTEDTAPITVFKKDGKSYMKIANQFSS